MESTPETTPKGPTRKKRWRAVMLNCFAVIGGIGLLAMLGFVNKQRSDTPIHSLEIDLTNHSDASFLDSAAIRAIVLKVSPDLIGTPTGEVNLHQIHDAVIAHLSIKQAQVYTTVDGRCKVTISQREPIARILNQDGSGFYLDKEGFTMPLSRHHTAQVPIFAGKLAEKLSEMPVHILQQDSTWAKRSHLDEIFDFTQFLHGNDFLAAQVEHVVFNDRGEMEIVPRVGNHRIVFGDGTELELKYRKLMAFYAQTLHSKDLNQYRKINLKYDNQVVCEKY